MPTLALRTTTGLKEIPRERLQALLAEGKVREDQRVVTADGGATWISVREALALGDAADEALPGFIEDAPAPAPAPVRRAPLASPRAIPAEADGEPAPPTSSTMALVGMILGITGLLCMPFLSIAAIILGIIALKRRQRSGFAWTGIITGIVGTIVIPVILAGLLLPAITVVKQKAQQQRTMNVLRQITIAAITYENEHRQTAPDLETLTAYVQHPGLGIHPISKQADDILYVRPAPDASVTQPIVLDAPSVWKGRGCVVAYADGSVRWLTKPEALHLWEQAQILSRSPAARGEGVPAEAWEP